MYSMIIVDDEYFTIEGMKLIIDWSFYNIEIVGTAVSGREGIALAKRLKPDIILSDIRMFGMDGISMLDTIRQEGIESKFIVMSGYKQFEYAQRAIEVGIESYVNYVTNKKMERAKSLLMNKDLSITEIANILSYKDINYFSGLFKKQVGMSPQKYRKMKLQELR